MSQRLIARNPLLKRLRDEGYNIQVPDGYLVVRDVPYVDRARAVARGVLMMPLDLTNDIVQPPKDHQAQFAGDVPCNADGTEIFGLAPSASTARAGNVVAKVNFSAKPIGTGKYKDIYHKVTSYLQRITGPVAAIDPTATARTFPLVADDDPESVFHYVDTASSRAEIVGATKKLMLGSVAILGLGGTGSYILDLIAKTPVKKIHIFDGDGFDQHNAFRAPGAASGEDLAAKLKKVDYFHAIYSRMHKGIVPHPEFMSEANLDALDGTDFVFIAMEGGDVKKRVVERLLARDIPFVDVGMGVYLAGDSIGGTLRVTMGTAAKNDHLKDRMPFTDGGIKNEYDKNIQIAALNMMNAALAVMQWQRHFGFIADQCRAHFTTFSIGRNETNNEDKA